jgi:hypothetical protein
MGKKKKKKKKKTNTKNPSQQQRKRDSLYMEKDLLNPTTVWFHLLKTIEIDHLEVTSPMKLLDHDDP